jgi:hypothetical protein
MNSTLTNQEILAAISQSAEKAIQALVSTEGFTDALSKKIARELYVPPLPKIPLFNVKKSDFLVEPITLADNTQLVLTERPIDSSSSFVVFVLRVPFRKPKEQSGIVMPTPEGNFAQTPAEDELTWKSMGIVYQDVPGDVTRNAIVQLQPHYQAELERQIVQLPSDGRSFYYVSTIGISQGASDAAE